MTSIQPILSTGSTDRTPFAYDGKAKKGYQTITLVSPEGQVTDLARNISAAVSQAEEQGKGLQLLTKVSKEGVLQAFPVVLQSYSVKKLEEPAKTEGWNGFTGTRLNLESSFTSFGSKIPDDNHLRAWA